MAKIRMEQKEEHVCKSQGDTGEAKPGRGGADNNEVEITQMGGGGLNLQ